MEFMIAAAVLLVVLFLALTILRLFKKPTTMRGYACKDSEKMNSLCNVDRIPKSLWQKVISTVIPLKYYVCHDCGKYFIRLQPIKKNKPSKLISNSEEISNN